MTRDQHHSDTHTGARRTREHALDRSDGFPVDHGQDLTLDAAFDAAGETRIDDPGLTSGVSAEVAAPASARSSPALKVAVEASPITARPAATSPARRCILCGCDCSDIGRTKDTKGRYFCMPCFRRALAAKQAGRPIAIPAAPSSAISDPARRNAANPADAPLSIDDFVISDDSPLRSAECTASLSAGWTSVAGRLHAEGCSLLCTECGTPMLTEALSCPACGAHALGGRRWSQRAGHPHRSLRLAEDPTIWTPLVAGVSTGLGAVGVVVGIALCVAAATSSTEVLVPLAGVGSFVGILFAWKLSAGIDLLRRRAVGVDHLRTWAQVTLVLLALATFGRIAWAIWSLPTWPSRIHEIGFAVVAGALLSAWPLLVRRWTSCGAPIAA
ncbi:MAG TPA: hypothetical protein PKC43_02460 [Phycisphaerales bacterium]|nr:hypothetical protein [Phycisphaerales bacterium]HMP36288.1 hypothetical protein [Phycisphaerales bacterium]